MLARNLQLDPLPLSDVCLARLEGAGEGSRAWFEALYDEGVRILASRGGANRAEARRVDGRAVPAGSRWWAVATLEFLRACVGCVPKGEFAMGALIAVAALALDQDDEALLATSDPEAALLALIASPRDRVLPGVVPRVIAMGARVVPALAAAREAERSGARWA